MLAKPANYLRTRFMFTHQPMVEHTGTGPDTGLTGKDTVANQNCGRHGISLLLP